MKNPCNNFTFGKSMYQLREIYVSILTNPFNDLEKLGPWSDKNRRAIYTYFDQTYKLGRAHAVVAPFGV